MTLEERIERLIQEQVASLHRADLFREPLIGFSDASDVDYANLKTIIGPWHKKPTEFLKNAKSVVSMFVPSTKEVAKAPVAASSVKNTWGEAYLVINSALPSICNAVIQLLESEGFNAITIPPTHTYDPKVLHAAWSHRSAGVISGIGTMGINRMIITKKGSAGRFCSVITSAPLTPSPKETAPRCLYLKSGTCKKCLEICAVDALNFNGFDKFKCQAETLHLAELRKDVENDTCGKCIGICPLSYIE